MSEAPNIDTQIDHEITIMSKMISIYCRGNHPSDNASKRKMGELCPECQELLDYALSRIGSCPVRQEKEDCLNCAVHCYKTDMRERIRIVMRYSGPRMLFYNPGFTIGHLLSFLKNLANKSSSKSSS